MFDSVFNFASCAAQLRELAHEVEGAPEEVGAAGAAAGMDSAVARRQLRQLEARAAAEEDLMMRVPLSKVRECPDNVSCTRVCMQYTALLEEALCALAVRFVHIPCEAAIFPGAGQGQACEADQQPLPALCLFRHFSCVTT